MVEARPLLGLRRPEAAEAVDDGAETPRRVECGRGLSDQASVGLDQSGVRISCEGGDPRNEVVVALGERVEDRDGAAVIFLREFFETKRT